MSPRGNADRGVLLLNLAVTGTAAILLSSPMQTSNKDGFADPAIVCMFEYTRGLHWGVVNS